MHKSRRRLHCWFNHDEMQATLNDPDISGEKVFPENHMRKTLRKEATEGHIWSLR